MLLTWAARRGPQSRILCLHPPHCEWRPLQSHEAAALRSTLLRSLEQKRGCLALLKRVELTYQIYIDSKKKKKKKVVTLGMEWDGGKVLVCYLFGGVALSSTHQP